MPQRVLPFRGIATVPDKAESYFHSLAAKGSALSRYCNGAGQSGVILPLSCRKEYPLCGIATLIS